jgi:hypothetical protein
MTPEEYEAEAVRMREEHDANVRELERAIAMANARAEEFTDADPTKAETAEAVRAHVVEMVPQAKTAILDLLLHAESEAVRAGLAKFVMAAGMKALEGDKEADEWATLIKKIGKENTANKS